MSRSLSPSRGAAGRVVGGAPPLPPAPARDGATRLVALLPPDAQTHIADYKPVARAQEEAKFFREAARHALGAAAQADAVSEVASLRDEEMCAEVLELQGPRVRLELPCRVRVPGLVLQLKDIGLFLSFEVHVRDAGGAPLSLLVSNRCSAIRLQGSQCVLPLETRPGWNLVRLDLADVVRRAFGREFGVCTGVVLRASLRVLRIYFESAPLEDSELPNFLRCVDDDGNVHDRPSAHY